ncbi:molybdopterin cofactor-binding domain-containing protein [Candidatus Neomarinimicrobiota bacterium]
MDIQNKISRREFIKVSSTASSALVIGFYLPWSKALHAQTIDSFHPNIWLSIDKDGIVTFTMPRSELGQKVWTSLTMIIAEELEADWTKMSVVQGDFNPAFGSQTTGGSTSIRTSYDKLRKAGATAREMLVMAAAQRWNVDKDSCRADNSTVIHIPTNRVFSYGELVTIASKLPIPENVTLKDPKQFKIIGKAYKSLDALEKIDGSAIYGYDFKVSGMLIALVARSKSFGRKPLNFNSSKALSISGVKKVFKISNGVAVVAENTWAAIQGRKALDITWDNNTGLSINSTDISNKLKEAAAKPGSVIRNDGDHAQALKDSKTILQADFEVPYLDHAPMEPMNCTALVKDGKCEIWAPTQNPGAAYPAAKSVTGFPYESIIVHTLRSGGAFGRRLQTDFVQDAVEVAMKVSKPVKVIRMRDEDIQHGFYRPATYHRVKTGIDEKGNPTAWKHRISGPFDDWHGIITMGAAELPYTIPNVYVDYVMSDIGVPIGAWRSVANTQNAFVNECMIDEMAVHAGKDPYIYRRMLLERLPRHRKVLDLAAEKAGWGKPLPENQYQGIAVHACFMSFAAVVAQISVDQNSKIKIHKMTCAIDCGTVINPDGVASQVEGGIAMGLTAALYGKITLKNGGVQQSNFHNYKLLSMKEMPTIETVIVPSTEPPTGAGEPPVPPTAPALVNAIFSATGKRIYRLPIEI